MKRFLGTALAKGVGGGAVIALHAVLTRKLDQSGYGLFALFQSTMLIVAIVGNAGWIHGITVLAARYAHRERWARYRGLVRFAHVSGTTAALILALLFYVLSPLFYAGADERLAFNAGLIGSPFLAAILIGKGLLRSRGKAGLSVLPDETVLPLMACLLFFFMSSLTFTGTAAIYIALVVAVFGATLIAGYLTAPAAAKEPRASYLPKHWTWFTLPMVAGEIGNIVISRTDILMIAALSTPQQTGAYSMAIRLASMLLLVHVVIWPWLSGRFAQAHAARDVAMSRKLIVESVLLAGGFALVPAAVMLVYPQFAVLIFGPAGETAINPMRLLVLAYLLHAATGALGLFMLMHGMQRAYSITALLAALLNICLNLLLIPRYGAPGAALTTLVTFAIWKTALAVQVVRYFRQGR